MIATAVLLLAMSAPLPEKFTSVTVQRADVIGVFWEYVPGQARRTRLVTGRGQWWIDVDVTDVRHLMDRHGGDPGKELTFPLLRLYKGER